MRFPIPHYLITKRYPLVLICILLLAAVLRFYHLASLPPSPYWEEAALGYDAYSILKTGKDHHGNPLPVIAFESFGDWKPSLYFYTAVPSIALFGLNTWAVRLPSALAGIGIVALLYVLPQVLLRLNPGSTKSKQTDVAKQIGLLSAFIVAIEPWAITFSRAAWEVNVATFLILGGVVAFLTSMVRGSKRAWLWQLCSVLLLGLSMYCYHAARLISPLLLLMMIGWSVGRARSSRLQLQHALLTAFITGLSFILLISPLLLSLSSPQVSSRFATENVFSNISIIERSNQLKDLSHQSLLARIQFHRFTLYSREILKNYTTYLNPQFLFIKGDSNLRHSVGYMSVLYPLDAIFLLLGFIFLWKKHRITLLFVTLWILIGLLPAVISQPNPHALRALPTLPAWILLLAFGIFSSVEWSWRKTSRRWITAGLMGCILTLYLLQLGVFVFYYHTVYVKRAASWWVYGYEQLYRSLDDLQQKTEFTNLPLYISRSQGRPAMYDWFYHQTDPHLVQQADKTTSQDQSEYLSFGNRTYFRDLSEITQLPAIVAVDSYQWQQLKKSWTADSLQSLETISSLDGTPAWYILIQKL